MNPVVVVWAVVAASLVFFMQAGFATREAGLTRSKNAVNVATKILAGTLVAAIVFWAWGFGLLGIGGGNEWIGSGEFAPTAPPGAGGAAIFEYFFYFAFAATALSIASGAVSERMRLVPWLFLAILFVGGIFPVFGHWALSGWLKQQGFVDAAGATWVHSLGGWMALAGALAVGPRAGRFVEGRKPARIPGSSVPLAVLGVFALWLGFIGENGAIVGRTSVDSLPHVVAETFVAGGAGGTVALIVGWVLRRKPEIELPMIGVIAGLAAIAGGAGAVSLPAALIIGAVAGALAVAIDGLLARGRIDDAVGAVPAHLGGGLWGTLAVALLSDSSQLGEIGRSGLLKAQLEGILACGIFGFGASFFALKLIGLTTKLRVEGEDEAAGLNIVEHDAHTELADLLDTMEDTARTGDMTARAPVEPFTEIGAIAKQYNRVMETIEFATAQTESLVRTSLDGLLTFGTDGILTSSNPAASAIFGYGEREFRAVSVTSLFAPSRDKTKGRADLQTLLKMFVGQTREVRGQRRNGEEFTMEASFTYVSVGEDEIYTATFRDITQRKETEAELNRAQAEIRRRLEQELEDAKVVQKALLPVETAFPSCEIARHYQAASETGGDWFGINYYPETQSVSFYIGDVTGHGLPAALMSGVVCGAVYSAELTHAVLGSRVDAEKQLRNIADVVNRIVLSTGKGELLMTMAFMYVNLRTGQLSFLNAGHNMPWMVKGGTQVSNVVARGSRLGEKEHPEFEVVHTKLDPGDVIVLYTDGLIENQGPDGKMLSVRDVKNVLTTKRSATEIRDELVNRAKAVWQDRQVEDDHSILVFRWTPQARTNTGPVVVGKTA